MWTKVLWRWLIAIGLALAWTGPAMAASQPPLTATNLPDPDTTNIVHVPGSLDESLQSAIDKVVDGGVIEITAGTYPAPSSGFQISNLNKRFTIRATTGETVVLTGNGSHRILEIRNTPSNFQGSITFQGITFSEGFDSTQLIGGGLTIQASNVTFIDCKFTNNVKQVYRTNTSAGAVLVYDNSTVFFFNNIWQGNSSEEGGAGLSVRDSKAFVHSSKFIGNRTTATSTSSMPVGGALDIANSTVRVTNTRFENNQAGGHGAAIYIIGEWTSSGSNVVLSNDTFINNQIVRQVGSSVPVEGGAINIEDNSLLKIYNSRFIKNSALIGGGVNIFRAKVEIRNSVFLGNRATDTSPSSGFGGAISFNFYDRPDAASLLVEDTYFQGRYSDVTTAAQFGGGIHAHGNLTSNKPPLTLRRVILNDLDVTGSGTKGALGGGLEITGVDFLMEDSLVTNSDARSSAGGFGGGMVAFANTNINIRRSVFANNISETFGGALAIMGSPFNITDSTFYNNTISPDFVEPDSMSYGAALYSAPDAGTGVPASGSVANSTFVKNVGLAIFDNDSTSAPINSVTYVNNRFYETTFGDIVYRDSLPANAQSPQGLNSLMVSHSGFSTDKAPQNDNQALSSDPDLAKLFVAPVSLIPATAAGDSESTTTSYLGYVWNGASGRLDGAVLSGHAGVLATTTSGSHSLSGGSASAGLQLPLGPQPSLDASLSSGSPNPQLSWSVTSGTFLSIDADQGLDLPDAPTGSVALPYSDVLYCLYSVTLEGGAMQTVDPRVPLLYAPDKAIFIVGLNQPNRTWAVPITNAGGQTIDWTASTDSPALLQLGSTSGSFETKSQIPFTLTPTQAGDYQAKINVDGGVGGQAQITVEVIVADVIHDVYLPITIR